ncbi:MAG TPA: acyltransferase [Candidatus Binatia bacterium]|nr:acyltransferase [Candidatus Binatia bacterium]
MPTTIDYAGQALVFDAVGEAVTIHPYCVFVCPERIRLGSHVRISEFTWIHGGATTVVGNFVHLANHSSIGGGGTCIAEDFVGFSAGARVVTGTEMIHGEGLTNPTIPAEFRAVRRSFVHLARHVFLGTNAVVHPGVTIGEGAVIGSGAVVTHDVEPWTINAGVPARPIGTRDGRRLHVLADRLYERLGVTPLDATPLLALKTESRQVPTD